MATSIPDYTAGANAWLASQNLDQNSNFVTPGSTAAPTNGAAPKSDWTGIINNAYRGEFGRDADTAGMNYWQSQINNGSITNAQQLDKAIIGGAQGSDITAHSDGANYNTAWRSDINPNGTLTYDPNKDQWNPVQQPVPMPTPGAASSSANTNSFGPTSYTATTRQVDPNELTSNQLTGLIAQNSPYLQQARSGAMIGANDRGLVNSSIAQGAAETAAINAALPIASANANTTNSVLSNNMNATNTAAQTNAQLATNLTATNMNNQTALQQTAMSTASQQAIARMNNSSQAAISAAHDANSVLLQNSQAAQQLFNQYQVNVANINNNNTMDEAAKKAAIETQTQIFNTAVGGLKAASPGVPDVSSMLDFGTNNTAATTNSANSADAAPATPGLFDSFAKSAGWSGG